MAQRQNDAPPRIALADGLVAVAAVLTLVATFAVAAGVEIGGDRTAGPIRIEQLAPPGDG
jgi:hypothetical protein